MIANRSKSLPWSYPTPFWGFGLAAGRSTPLRDGTPRRNAAEVKSTPPSTLRSDSALSEGREPHHRTTTRLPRARCSEDEQRQWIVMTLRSAPPRLKRGATDVRGLPRRAKASDRVDYNHAGASHADNASTLRSTPEPAMRTRSRWNEFSSSSASRIAVSSTLRMSSKVATPFTP